MFLVPHLFDKDSIDPMQMLCIGLELQNISSTTSNASLIPNNTTSTMSITYGTTPVCVFNSQTKPFCSFGNLVVCCHWQ